MLDISSQLKLYGEIKSVLTRIRYPNPWGAAPYNGLYGEALSQRGNFFRLWVFKRVRISQVEIYKSREISPFGIKRAFTGNCILNRHPLWMYQFIY